MRPRPPQGPGKGGNHYRKKWREIFVHSQGVIGFQENH
jgi:hypothetical protein